jgi:hypothetical protein
LKIYDRARAGNVLFVSHAWTTPRAAASLDDMPDCGLVVLDRDLAAECSRPNIGGANFELTRVGAVKDGRTAKLAGPCRLVRNLEVGLLR